MCDDRKCSPTAGLLFTLAELQEMPTIREGHFADLKVEVDTEDRGVRIWLSRCTVADGAEYDNQVTIQRRTDSWDWVDTMTYQAKGRKKNS